MSSYTPEITRAIISSYKKLPTSTTILLLAEQFKKSPNSIRVKLVYEGIYNRMDLIAAFCRGPLCVISHGFMAKADDDTICISAGRNKIFVSRATLMSILTQAGATVRVASLKKIRSCQLSKIREILVANIELKTSIETVSILVWIGECLGLDLFLPDIISKQSA